MFTVRDVVFELVRFRGTPVVYVQIGRVFAPVHGVGVRAGADGLPVVVLVDVAPFPGALPEMLLLQRR